MNAQSSCIFCKIVAGSVPSPRFLEDERFIAIADIRPQAKKHFLVIPKQHIATLADAGTEAMGGLLEAGVRVAREQGLLPVGFRAVINTGEGGGQTVFHLHLHVLGGEQLDEAL